jgi:hypothetical protein
MPLGDDKGGYPSSLFRGWQHLGCSSVLDHPADLAVASLSLNRYFDIAGPRRILW